MAKAQPSKFTRRGIAPQLRPQVILGKFEKAPVPQKIAVVVAGLAVVGTAPFWAPVLWRSRTVRRLAVMGAGQALDMLLS